MILALWILCGQLIPLISASDTPTIPQIKIPLEKSPTDVESTPSTSTPVPNMKRHFSPPPPPYSRGKEKHLPSGDQSTPRSLTPHSGYPKKTLLSLEGSQESGFSWNPLISRKGGKNSSSQWRVVGGFGSSLPSSKARSGRSSASLSYSSYKPKEGSSSHAPRRSPSHLKPKYSSPDIDYPDNKHSQQSSRSKHHSSSLKNRRPPSSSSLPRSTTAPSKMPFGDVAILKRGSVLPRNSSTSKSSIPMIPSASLMRRQGTFTSPINGTPLSLSSKQSRNSTGRSSSRGQFFSVAPSAPPLLQFEPLPLQLPLPLPLPTLKETHLPSPFNPSSLIVSSPPLLNPSIQSFIPQQKPTAFASSSSVSSFSSSSAPHASGTASASSTFTTNRTKKLPKSSKSRLKAGAKPFVSSIQQSSSAPSAQQSSSTPPKKREQSFMLTDEMVNRGTNSYIPTTSIHDPSPKDIPFPSDIIIPFNYEGQIGHYEPTMIDERINDMSGVPESSSLLPFDQGDHHSILQNASGEESEREDFDGDYTTLDESASIGQSSLKDGTHIGLVESGLGTLSFEESTPLSNGKESQYSGSHGTPYQEPPLLSLMTAPSTPFLGTIRSLTPITMCSAYPSYLPPPSPCPSVMTTISSSFSGPLTPHFGSEFYSAHYPPPPLSLPPSMATMTSHSNCDIGGCDLCNQALYGGSCTPSSPFPLYPQTKSHESGFIGEGFDLSKAFDKSHEEESFLAESNERLERKRRDSSPPPLKLGHSSNRRLIRKDGGDDHNKSDSDDDSTKDKSTKGLLGPMSSNLGLYGFIHAFYNRRSVMDDYGACDKQQLLSPLPLSSVDRTGFKPVPLRDFVEFDGKALQEMFDSLTAMNTLCFAKDFFFSNPPEPSLNFWILRVDLSKLSIWKNNFIVWELLTVELFDKANKEQKIMMIDIIGARWNLNKSDPKIDEIMAALVGKIIRLEEIANHIKARELGTLQATLKISAISSGESIDQSENDFLLKRITFFQAQLLKDFFDHYKIVIIGDELYSFIMKAIRLLELYQKNSRFSTFRQMALVSLFQTKDSREKMPDHLLKENLSKTIYRSYDYMRLILKQAVELRNFKVAMKITKELYFDSSTCKRTFLHDLNSVIEEWTDMDSEDRSFINELATFIDSSSIKGDISSLYVEKLREMIKTATSSK